MISPKIFDSLHRQRSLQTGINAFMYIDINSLHLPFYPNSKKIPSTLTGHNLILLGLGANLSEDIIDLTTKYKKVFYVECDNFLMQIGLNIPSSWKRLNVEELLNSMIFFQKQGVDFLFYHQNMQLFPSFWGSLLGQLEKNIAFHKTDSTQNTQYNTIQNAEQNSVQNTVQDSEHNTKHNSTQNIQGETKHDIKTQKRILLACSRYDLLFKELHEASTQLGFNVDLFPEDFFSSQGKDHEMGGEIKNHLLSKPPQLFLSVNLKGYDTGGHLFYLLHELQIPQAIWFVDNPWNILSVLRQDWWKDIPLFISDASFMDGLKKAGAKKVYYLPLAASSFFQASQAPKNIDLLFVGHSSFPKKEAFFSASTINKDILNQATLCIQQNYDVQGFPPSNFPLSDDSPADTSLSNASPADFPTSGVSSSDISSSGISSSGISFAYPLPDFHWWTNMLENPDLWPGNEVRAIGAGTIASDKIVRSFWLKHLAPHLHLVGDSGWNDMFQADQKPILLAPVDYYSTLPQLYQSSSFVLNLTSLLMPQALTQRHFDVWMSGSFLFTSPSLGIQIFPQELQDEMIVYSPQNLLQKKELLKTKPRYILELIAEFQNEIRSANLYKNRLTYLCQNLDLS